MSDPAEQEEHQVPWRTSKGGVASQYGAAWIDNLHDRRHMNRPIDDEKNNPVINSVVEERSFLERSRT